MSNRQSKISLSSLLALFYAAAFMVLESSLSNTMYK